MYVYRGLWKIPAVIVAAIVIGEVIRRNYSEDARFILVVVVLSLMYIVGKVFMYYDKKGI